MLIMYLRSAMDFITSILIFLFWIFIVNVATRFFKKAFGADNEKDKESKPTTTIPEGPSPEEVFRELRKKMEEARKHTTPTVTEHRPIPPADRRNQDAPEKQEVYRQREVTSEREKRSSEEFQKALSTARKREHDADPSRLSRKEILAEVEQEATPEFELDLRNAMIGSIILERPYS